jgi:hypothetical protein
VAEKKKNDTEAQRLLAAGLRGAGIAGHRTMKDEIHVLFESSRLGSHKLRRSTLLLRMADTRDDRRCQLYSFIADVGWLTAGRRQHQIHTLLLEQFVSVLIDTENRKLTEAHLKTRHVVQSINKVIILYSAPSSTVGASLCYGRQLLRCSFTSTFRCIARRDRLRTYTVDAPLAFPKLLILHKELKLGQRPHRGA